MPKKFNNKPFWGGRGRGGNSEDKHYFGHDDRMRGSSNSPKCRDNNNLVRNKQNQQRRVSFKKSNAPNPLLQNRALLMKRQLDDDVLMSAGSHNNSRQIVNRGRSKGFLRGRNSPLPYNGGRDGRPGQLKVSESNWYRVFIPHGQKFTKEFILCNLVSCTAPLTFTPVMYKVIGSDVAFYVEDHKIASKLADCDKRITTSDGFKIQIRVKPGMPPIEISDDVIEKLKLAMEKRYVQETNALNLSKFSHDPDLAGDYWCPLSRSNMLITVLDIVKKYIPHLEALNLESNKIYNIEKLGYLGAKFEKLKILHIGDNKIKEMKYLNVLKNLQLKELQLKGNPVCNKYKERWDDYVNDIRRIFPKLLKLDGKELPPPILFDVEDQKKLPTSQKMYIYQSNTKAQEVASQFLQQYFMVFDSDNRQPLLAAYHEHALFSLTVNIVHNSSYFSNNRNLCRVVDSSRRRKLLKQGKLQVVSFISEMSRTKHDLASFTMDLTLVTEGMMLISVTGLFKDLSNRDTKEQIRYFERTFIIVPEGTGFCIRSDQLYIGNPTSNQEKQFGIALPVVQPTPGPSTAPTPVATPVPLAEEMKQQMTMTLSQQTNMNIAWSLKCLEDVQWNFDNACAAFQEAFSSGKIPPTAFMK